MYQLKLTEGAARRGALTTVHGTVQTPAFMNVATAAAIKGGISAYDLKELKCHLMRANEMLGMRLAVMHNLWFYNTLMEEIRLALDEGRFESFYREHVPILGKRI